MAQKHKNRRLDRAVFLFWSYKGGQGRTWACANFGLTLALKGAKVLLLDMDYRAPGLPFYFVPLSDHAKGAALGEPLPGAPSYGLVDGLLRWFTAYCRGFDKQLANPSWASGYDFTQASTPLEWLEQYRTPNEDHDSLPDEHWRQDWCCAKDATPPAAPMASPIREGGLADIILPISLQNNELLDLHDPRLKAEEPGALFLAPCGNIDDPIFRHHFAEGYPWRILTDPASAKTRPIPLTFAEVFYSAVSYLADVCDAEFVFIDMPAGVSNITKQLLFPRYKDRQGREHRFKGGFEPTGVVAVTTLANQALTGTSSMLFNKTMNTVPEGAHHYGDAVSPDIVDAGRATLLYNLVDPTVRSMEETVRTHADRIGLRLRGCDVLELSVPPFSIGFLSEWLVPLSKVELTYLKKATHAEDFARQRTTALEKLHAWTGAEGPLIQIRDLGSKGGAATAVDVTPPSLRITAEDVPTLNAFLGAFTADPGPHYTAAGINKLVVKRLSHPQLFDILDFSKPRSLRDFRKSCGLAPPTRRPMLSVITETLTPNGPRPDTGKQHSLTLPELLTESDILAIPHYMLGTMYHNERGIVSFDEVLGSSERSRLEREVHHFEELCCYNNAWCAFPYTLITKLVYSRRPLSSKRRRYQDLAIEAGIANYKAASAKPWILLEARVDSLSLWYEWEQLATSFGAVLLTRQHGHDVPIVIAGGDAQGKRRVLEAIRCHWHLIRSQRTDHLGRVDWTDSQRHFTTGPYEFWLGWSDWAHTQAADAQNTGRDLYFASLPREEIAAPKQPLEGWVFVIPRSSDEQKTSFFSRVLLDMMSHKWQQAYQSRGGSSAFRAVLKDTESQDPSQSPWVPVIEGTLANCAPRGTTRLAHAYAKATLTFLTFVLFGRSATTEQFMLASNDTELDQRFEEKWDQFIEVLRDIKNQER